MNELPTNERIQRARAKQRALIARLPLPVRSIATTLIDTYEAWRDDRTIRLGAGLAYYGLFSLASVLTLSLWIVQILGSRADIEQYLTTALQDALGDSAPAAASAISSAIDGSIGGQLGLVGLVSLIVTGSLFFLALEDALNLIWGVPVRHGWRWTIRRRLTSFLVLFGAATTLILSLSVQAVTSLAERLVPDVLAATAVVSLIATSLGWLVLAGAIVLLFRFLPAAEVDRRAAFLSGVVTGALLIIGTAVFGWYLRTYGATSVSGAAASVIVVLVWIFYEAQILLAGAQLSKVLTRQRASRAVETASVG